MNILLVRNSSSGGIAKNVEEIARGLAESGVGTVLLEPTLDGFRYSSRFSGPPDAWTEVPKTDIPDTAQLIRSWDIGHCHIHSQLGFETRTWAHFIGALSELGIGYDVTLHDYSFSCPRVNLVDFTRKYCGEPDVDQCEMCVAMNPPPLFSVDSVRDYRHQSSLFLSGARKIFVPTDDVGRRVARQLGENLAYVVRPHKLQIADEAMRFSQPAASPERDIASAGVRQRKIAILGSLTIHKGSELALAVANVLQRGHPEVALHLIGASDRDPEFAALENTVIWGAYENDEILAQKLESLAPELVWFPAIWPETYSYTLDVAMSLGFRIAYFDFGGIKNRAQDYVGGHPLPYELMLQPENLSQALIDSTLGIGLLSNKRTAAPRSALPKHLTYFDYPRWPRNSMEREVF